MFIDFQNLLRCKETTDVSIISYIKILVELFESSYWHEPS